MVNQSADGDGAPFIHLTLIKTRTKLETRSIKPSLGGLDIRAFAL
jgi:hypothetical protein